MAILKGLEMETHWATVWEQTSVQTMGLMELLMELGWAKAWVTRLGSMTVLEMALD